MAKSEEKKSRRRLQLAQITSVISVTLVMTVLGALGLTFLISMRLSEYAKEQFSLQLVLSEVMAENDVAPMQSGLEKLPFSRKVNYISKEMATQEYLAYYPNDFMDVLDYNPLPRVFEVYIRAEYVQEDSIASIEKSLQNNYPLHITDIEKDPLGVRETNQNLRLIGLFMAGLLSLLTFIMLVLIHNTIRLTIYSRRFIIRTMQLVGATSKFIRRPFLRAGFWQGFISAVLASGITAAAAYLLHKEESELFPQQFLVQTSILLALIFMFSLLVTWFSTLLAVGKFLRTSTNRLY